MIDLKKLVFFMLFISLYELLWSFCRNQIGQNNFENFFAGTPVADFH